MDAAAGAVPATIAGLDRVALGDPVFISDLHLCAKRPRTLERLLRLAGETRAAQLVVLGDLLEYWAGDDAIDAPDANDRAAIDAAQALRGAASRGVAVYFMHGNRDVLAGSRLLDLAGARLLGDPCLARIGTGASARAVLLSHGDAWCTLDVAYQAFRRQARDAAFQAAFLARPLAERRTLIGQARAASESNKSRLDSEIMDVTPEAIEDAFRTAQVDAIIHGHTHRPMRHELTVDARACVRWVLPDWELDEGAPRGGGLHVTASRLEYFPL